LSKTPIDYTTIGPNGPYSQTQNPYAARWWKAPKSERAQAVTAVIKAIGEYDTKRLTQYQTSTRLYGNTALMGVNGVSLSKVQSAQGAVKDRLTYNVCQSVVDTITSKIAKNKPKPMFLTSGGDYRVQRKAKKLDKFVEGVFYENGAHHLGPLVFRDACVSGDGLVHVFAKDGRVKFERVLASEIYVDWVDAFYGEPRQLHRVKNVDRAILLDTYPEKRDLILTANAASADMTGVNRNVADVVTVSESWHLPSGPDAGDGLHVIALPNGELFSEEWTKSYFPFAKFTWCKRLFGYWGQGLVEQIQNIQLEINKILWVIQRSFHLAGSFKILLEHGSKIVKEHLNNDIGAIVSYSGTPPQYVVPQIVASEMYTHLQTLKNSAYEQAGISQLSAVAQKPAGLDSGKALREYNNIESDRFMTTGQGYEQFYLDLARLTVDVAKDIFEHDKKLEVRVPGSKFIETIDWKDVNLEDDEYVMKMYPVSSFSQEPAARMQEVQERVQAGWLTMRQAKKLMDFPDLEMVDSLSNATEEYLNEILEKIIEDGEFTPPEPYDDLGVARELALQYYAQGKCNGLEEEKLDMLRDFMDQIDVLEQKTASAVAQAAPQGAEMPGSGGPQAVPEAPPTSGLLPNAPGAAA
jgi:hypothetical protein